MERQADSISTNWVRDPGSSGKIRRRVRLPVVHAKGADHATVYYFLQSAFQGSPAAAEFQAALEDPFYEPHDRLLLRQRRRIAAHVQLTHRTMHFGPTAVPVAGLDWLAVATEHRGQGLGAHLLRAAEVRMRNDGALLGVLRTSIPDYFSRAGWALCCGVSYRRANVRALLAQLLDHGMIPRRRRRFHIRPLLRWEYPALGRIYAQNLLQSLLQPTTSAPAEPEYGPARRWPPIVGLAPHGSLERTEAYWKWLLDRRGHDQLYVALKGPELLDVNEINTRVVGYAATRGEQVLELMTVPEQPRAAAALLARCCGEAIEHDRHCILLHAPPSSPLFQYFDQSGGAPTGDCRLGKAYMMRLLDPLGFLRRLQDEFDRRAAAARLPRPLDLGLLIEGRKFQLELRREGVRATSERIGRSYLRLDEGDFTRLLLGQLDWDAAAAARRLECSTLLAHEAGRALFPQLHFWRPPWDDLPAVGKDAGP